MDVSSELQRRLRHGVIDTISDLPKFQSSIAITSQQQISLHMASSSITRSQCLTSRTTSSTTKMTTSTSDGNFSSKGLRERRVESRHGDDSKVRASSPSLWRTADGVNTTVSRKETVYEVDRGSCLNSIKHAWIVDTAEPSGNTFEDFSFRNSFQCSGNSKHSVKHGESLEQFELRDYVDPDGKNYVCNQLSQLGHLFVSVNLVEATWCDYCGNFIWGYYKKCFVCTNCEYTCHENCRSDVAVECSRSRNIQYRVSADKTATNVGVAEGLFHRSPSRRRLLIDLPKVSAFFNHGGLSLAEGAGDVDSGYNSRNSTGTASGANQRLVQAAKPRDTIPLSGHRTLTREELRHRIEAFNHSHKNHGLVIDNPREDSTFQGAVRVHMHLIRPINQCTSVKPPSTYDSLSTGTVHQKLNVTSFYLPQGTTTVIRVSSTTTAQEVIRNLLSKFQITDNPRKFALYEKNQIPGKPGTMRRLEEDACPLQLLLSWADVGLENLDHNTFVLQENDTGEIMWDAFSLPELENFLQVLNREEDEYIDQVKTKYRLLKIQLQKRLPEKEYTVDKRTPVFV